MASPYPTNTQALFDWLNSDPELIACLGIYTYPDGTILPAIARLWDHEQLPEGTDVQGVELVIRRESAGSNRPTIGRELIVESTMRAYIMLWRMPDAPQPPQLEPALERLQCLLPGVSWQDVTPPSGLGSLAQYAITWRNPAGMAVAAGI